MNLHDYISVRGCITQEKYIKGRTLKDIERILGFHQGRLSKGMIVAALLQTPSKRGFELLGYTQVAGHRFDKDALKTLDVDKLKELVMQNAFTTVGTNRLVKVIPNIPHSNSMTDDEQYPPGWGVPQWKLTTTLTARVIAVVKAGETYI